MLYDKAVSLSAPATIRAWRDDKKQQGDETEKPLPQRTGFFRIAASFLY
jgi:hypothetical protein